MDNLTPFFTKKNLINLLVLIVLVIALPIAIDLAKKQQILRSRASVNAIELVDGDCVEERYGKKVLICDEVPLKLTSPLGPPKGRAGRSTPKPTPSPTKPSSSALPQACNSSTKTADGRPVVNVKNFNNNIQQAIDCFKNSTTGGAIYIPAGTYPSTKKISVYSNVTVFGDGIDKTIITASSTTEGGMSNDSSRGQSNIVIRDLTLKGPGNKGGECCFGLKLENITGGFIINVAADNWGMDGIYLGYKIKESQLRGANNIRVTGCRANNNDRNGISITQGNNNVIDKCFLENNNADPVKRAAAIDLEPDSGGETSNNLIQDNILNKNKGNGISLGPNPNEPDPKGKLLNNVVCFNTTNDGDFAGITDYPSTIYVGNKGNDPRPRDNGTERACSIPASLNTLPQAPSRPITQVSIIEKIAKIFSFQFISEVLAGCSSDEDCGGGENGGTSYCDKQGSTDGSGTCRSQGRVAGSDRGSSGTSGGGGGGKKNKKDKSESPSPSPRVSFRPLTSTSPKASGLPSVIPSSFEQTVTTPYTKSFKVAESESELSKAEENDYEDHPTIFYYELIDDRPGSKQIWVQFIDSEGKIVKKSVNISLVEEDPEINKLSCKLDLTAQGVTFEILGARFGSPGQSSSVDLGGQALEVLDWTVTSITAILPNPSSNQEFNIKVIREDGQETEEVPCKIGFTQLSLGTELFCREKGNSSEEGVQLIFVDEAGNKTQEVVSIAPSGVVKDIKTKLESAKQYLVSVKVESGLRRNASFKAGEGTQVVKDRDGKDLLIPIGDISPVNGGDGAINTADKFELNRQWVVAGRSGLSGDFNRDGKVNSIDWACMRHGFGLTDDPLP